MTNGWTPAQMPSQTGRRFFITGANSGIGYAAAVELARKGACVVLACRDRTRGEAALQQLKQEVGSEAEADLVLLDLASQASIRQVAEAELASGRNLHGLINNAGVMRPPKRLETKDNFELQFGTNVLGHFALTCRLMPALERSRSAYLEDAPRIVTVSSIAHRRAVLNFDDLQQNKGYNPMRAYGQSKLANLMFAFELERRLRIDSKGSVSIAVHPGVAESNLFKIGSSSGIAASLEKIMSGTIGALLNNSLEGALPTLFAATAPEAKGGAYYGPQGFQEMRGGDVGPAFISAAAQEVAAQKRLWQTCQELTGCSL